MNLLEALLSSRLPGNGGSRLVSVSGSTPTIRPAAGNRYQCGTLDALRVVNPPETGLYTIIFTSGQNTTVSTMPSTILGLDHFAAEANRVYEINVLDNRALIGSWAVSAT